MSTISIIGVGTMATAIAGRIARAGHTVEVINRDTDKAQALADKLASGATTGTYGAVPAGEIVIIAVPYAGVAAVVADFGEALDGKVNIDIANPVAPDLSRLVTSQGSSGAQETKAMRCLIENAESDVNGFGDAEIISDFASFKERSQSAFAYEETHGEDSLRKWDHPFNIRLCDMGLLKRPQEA